MLFLLFNKEKQAPKVEGRLSWFHELDDFLTVKTSWS